MRASWAYLLLGASLTFCAAAEEALSSDFLEFLGTGTSVREPGASDAQWIDPLSLQESPEVFDDVAADDAPAKAETEGRKPHSTFKFTSSTVPDDGGKHHD